jgi:transposase
VAEDHLSRLILSLVRESLDLSEIAGSYTSGLGQPRFDPQMMTGLLLHSYASGLYSSRRIARATVERADFMMIVAGDPPDFRTISDFRKRHLKALAALFVQVLKLAEKAGLVKLGRVALDGAKIKANASKHKAMRPTSAPWPIAGSALTSQLVGPHTPPRPSESAAARSPRPCGTS